MHDWSNISFLLDHVLLRGQGTWNTVCYFFYENTVPYFQITILRRLNLLKVLYCFEHLFVVGLPLTSSSNLKVVRQGVSYADVLIWLLISTSFVFPLRQVSQIYPQVLYLNRGKRGLLIRYSDFLVSLARHFCVSIILRGVVPWRVGFTLLDNEAFRCCFWKIVIVKFSIRRSKFKLRHNLLCLVETVIYVKIFLKALLSLVFFVIVILTAEYRVTRFLNAVFV